MKVIEKKNGYTLAITNQGHGDRIILMFPGETEKNPHSWLGEPTAANIASAKRMLNEFAGTKDACKDDSIFMKGSKDQKAPFIYEDIDGNKINKKGTPFDKNGFTTVNGKRYHGNFLRFDLVDDSDTLADYAKSTFKDADWGNGMSSASAKLSMLITNVEQAVSDGNAQQAKYRLAKLKEAMRMMSGAVKNGSLSKISSLEKKVNSMDSKLILTNVLKAMDSIEEKLATKPQGEVDANNIIADKRLFIKLYEDVNAEKNRSNGKMIISKMQKTLNNILNNVESDFDREDVDKFKRLLEIAQRKVDRMAL